MKHLFFLATLLGFVVNAVSLQACELYWFLAASMSKPGKETVAAWNQQSGNCRVYLVVGGSGQILSQLAMARKGDLYTPAAESFLEKAKNQGIVAHQRLLLEQTPVFGLSRSAGSKIRYFKDLTKSELRIALGNKKTMALGKTYLKIEQKMDPVLSKQIRHNTILEAINITQIVNYLLTDTVDAGIVFDTTARANGIEFVEIPSRFNVVNKAYLVSLTFSEHTEARDQFIDFIFQQGDIFKKYGFSLSLGTD